MKNLFKYVFMLMVVAMGTVVFTSCGSNDEDSESDTNTSLSGTSWKINSITDSDGSDMVGVVMTFGSDGNVTYSPEGSGWTYAKWTQNGNSLKIMLGEGHPDDYMQGTFVINGKNAIYTYSWYDQSETYSPKTKTYTITLTKQ